MMIRSRGFQFWVYLWVGMLCLTRHSFLAPAPLFAQEDTNRISYNETISGQLEAESFRDLYVFAGRQGEIITISLNATEGNLDPYLVLIDRSGQGIAFSDDEGIQQAALIESLRLPYDGDYFLVATRFGHDQGTTTGSYELRLERIGATTSTGATLQYGDDIVGEITPTNPQLVYVFEGQRGEVVNLHMRRTSGNLDPMMDLANAEGQILLTGDDDPTASGTLNAGILNFTLPYDGFFIIVATRYGRESGDTQGTFLLSLDNIPADVRGVSPSSAILVDYGRVLTGSINAETPQRFYVLEGQRGDVISLEMLRESGNLNTVLILLDSELTELLRAGEQAPYDRAQITAYPLPETNRYYIMVTRRDFAAGETSGEFMLTIAGRSGYGTNYIQLEDNGEVAGFINNVLPYENFTFQGAEGDNVTLRMNTLSGDLDPLLTLYLADKQIAFDDNSGDKNNAAILGFVLPENGIYRVEASRVSREAGATEGAYTLRLEIR